VSECVFFAKIITMKFQAERFMRMKISLQFLDLLKLTPGPTLVLPKKHVVYSLINDKAISCDCIFAVFQKSRVAIKQSDLTITVMNIVNNNGLCCSYQSVIS